jgi:hypothetical protein
MNLVFKSTNIKESIGLKIGVTMLPFIIYVLYIFLTV